MSKIPEEIVTFWADDFTSARGISASQGIWLRGGLLILALGLLPVYLFPSGGFQVVDGPLFILLAVYFLRRSAAPPDLWQNITSLLPFLIWAGVVNVFYFFSQPSDYLPLITSAQLLYTFLLFMTFSFLFWDLLQAKKLGILYAGILLSFILIFTVKGYIEEGVRSELSFNNPNQLGYYGLILSCLAALLFQMKENYVQSKVFFFWCDVLILFMAHILVLLSFSRGAILALFFIDLWIVPKLTKRIAVVCLPILILLLFSLAWQPAIIQERLSVRPGKTLDQKEIIQEVNSRILHQFSVMEGFYYLVGRGGRSFTLKEKSKGIGEVHNVFGEVLRTYGLIGLGLFSFWIARFIWRSRRVPGALWICAALLTYNMAHYGLRFRSLWILLAFLNVMLCLAGRSPAKEATKVLSGQRDIRVRFGAAP